MALRSLILILLIVWIAASCNKQEKKSKLHTEKKSGQSLQYDSLKAKKYGADAYGMKKYIFAFLKKGDNRNIDSSKARELQMAHLKNIGKMADAGILVLAGPFFGNDSLRGLYIFNVASIEEAEKLTNTDPAIQAGSLRMELREWYGSAALMEVNRLHKTLAKTGIVE